MVKRLDRHHRVTVEPFQKPGLPEAFGLTIAECEQMAWAVTPDGSLYGGAGAVNLAGAVALRIRMLLGIYVLPGMRQIQDWIYAWVVRNRHRLPGDMPHCQLFPEDCRD